MNVIERQTLLTSLKKCLPGIEKNASIIPGADTFLFSGGKVHAYNDKIAISTPIDVGFEGSVKALDLFRLLSRFASLTVELDVREGKLYLAAGRTKANLVLLNSVVDKYITAMNLDVLQWKPVPVDFTDALRLCRISDNKTPLQGFCSNGNSIYATDSSRISAFTLSAEMDPFWVDDSEIMSMLAIGSPVDYVVNGSWLHVRFEDGTVFSCKRKDHGQYPVNTVAAQLEACKAAESRVKGRLPDKMGEVVERVGTLAGTSTTGSLLVRLTFTNLGIEFYSVKPTGEVSEDMAWETPVEGDINVQIWVETDFLMEACKKVMDFRVIEIGDMKVLVFSTEGYTQMISSDLPAAPASI